MKTFVIDPEERTITEATYEGDIEEIYELGDFDRFAVAEFNLQGDAAYVDDEGLFKVDPHFFVINGYPQPLAGKGIVLGCNEDGETVEPSVTLDWLKENVVWYTP